MHNFPKTPGPLESEHAGLERVVPELLASERVVPGRVVPELLAPAGSFESLRAAVSAGADAVYLGLDEFNARRNADNFTLESLKEACDYAHLRGVRVYVTMNVEILPQELNRAVATVLAASEAGADGFIVQDIGLAAEVHRVAPWIALHASTQMNIHNAAGVEFCAVLGMKRITLARELSLEEVAHLSALAAELGLETECFVHGALCVCYSGQCLMSSLIGGRSANRGLCAQACRLPYRLHRDGRVCNGPGDRGAGAEGDYDAETGAAEGEALSAPGEHLLSPRDLCGIDLLTELSQAGVASLKVEGRMKSPDYVWEVVRVYREALDGLAATGAAAATDEQHHRLSEAFSRGFTTAYLEGQRGNEIMSYGQPNNRGVFIGRVSAVETAGSAGAAEAAGERGAQSPSTFAVVKVERDLHRGDLVEFWTNKGHFTAQVDADAPAGTAVRISVEQRTGKGDRVFRVRNAAGAFADDPFAPRIPIGGTVVLREGQPAYLQFFTSDGMTAEVRGAIVEAARTKPLDEESVRTHVGRLGQTPFVLSEELGGLNIEVDGRAGMGFSTLHHLRAEALELLEQEMLAPFAKPSSPGYKGFSETVVIEPEAAQEAAVCAWVTSPGCARDARKAGVDRIYVPLLNFRRGQAALEGVRQDAVDQAGYPKQCIMALPVIDHDPLPGSREEQSSFDPWDYVKADRPVFADNIGDAWRALQMGALVEIGPHIPATNKATIAFLARLGFQRLWLSPELTLGQIAALAEDAPLALGLFASGAQELMVTEHCLLMSQGPCAQTCETCERRGRRHHLTDRKGFDFPVVTDMLGRSHLYNGVELDAAASLEDLIAMGVEAFMVDTTLLDRKTTAAACKRILRARDLALTERRSIEKRPGTTTGHLFRGVM